LRFGKDNKRLISNTRSKNLIFCNLGQAVASAPPFDAPRPLLHNPRA